MHPDLAWQNYVVAQCAQAMIGLISHSIRQVGCVVTEQKVELRFFADRSEDLLEDIDDICFELDVLLDSNTEIAVSIDSESLDWSAPGLRGLYSAKL